MNFMEKLLDGVEVEWKPLCKVGELVRGNGLPKTDFTEIGVPAIHYGQIYTYYGTFTTETISFVSVETAKKLKKVDTGDVVITNTSENLEDVGKAVVYLGKMQAVTGGHATIFKPSNKITGKYFAYFTQTEMFARQKRKFAKGTKVIDVSATDMSKIIIPIPPIKVQEEIVRILDDFTELKAELTAKLTANITACKKQYNYYCDKLLTFEDGEVEWKQLGEMATFSQGLQVDISNQFYEKQENFVRFLRIVDFVKEDEIPRYIKNPGQRYIKEDGELVMIRYGASAAGKVFLDHDGAIANNMFKINLISAKISVKFLFTYLAQPKIYNNLNSSGGTSTMPAITFGQIGSVKIPIPYPNDLDKSFAEQEHIVSILDKFNALTSSITESLTREIELRQKQYEYYRNMLFSFPKKEEN